MKDFWDSVYSKDEYIYGLTPNNYFKIELSKLEAGRVLLPAEGEGRNAVWAAKNNWNVEAFDYSTTAKKKALKLAEVNNAIIEYSTASIDDFTPNKNSYDCIALIYVHQPAEKRKDVHQRIIGMLKPGGTLILEGFSKDQIERNSGGPKNIDMLFSKEELMGDFDSLLIVDLQECQVTLNEGELHNGEASVIRLTAMKPMK